MKTKIVRKIINLLCFTILIISQQSCYRKFYKVSDSNISQDPATTIKQQTGKYFILRSGTKAYHMEDIVLDSSDKSIRLTLGSLSNDHLSYVTVTKNKGIPYKKSLGEDAVLNEVHVYIPADTTLRYPGFCNLEFTKISKIEVLEKDKGRTTTSTIISTTGIVVSAAAILFGLGYAVSIATLEGL